MVVKTIYRYCKVLGLICVLSLVCSYSLPAQRARATRPKAIDYLERAKQGYDTYQFEDALDAWQSYEALQRKAKKTLPLEEIHFGERLERAERMMRYTETVRLVDSLSFPQLDLHRVLSSLSPYLANILCTDVSDVYSLRYSAPIGGRAVISRPVEGKGYDLFRVDTLGQSREVEIAALGEVISTENDEISPFVLPDGLSIWFARQSTEGLGGYDLYWSRYNVGRSAYYAPILLGMPYNSIANDYLLAYDDQADITYLLSDRFQPQGYLVLYRFAGLPRALTQGVSAGVEDDVDLPTLRSRALLMLPAEIESPLARDYKADKEVAVIDSLGQNTITQDNN